jgi:hypothetical protein
MNNIPQNWQESFQLGLSYAVAQFTTFLPRILGAFLVFVVGLIVARIVRRLVVKALETFRVSKIVEKTPVELFLRNTETSNKIEELIGGIFYWLFLFLVIYTSVSLLGLEGLTAVFNKVLGYIPHIFSAIVIFVLGVLLAGIVESVVKGMLKSIGGQGARLFAKIASYLVVTVAILAAIAELGIASEFIRIMFFGAVFCFSLGFGLAIGLGGQDVVRKILNSWYERSSKIETE